MRQISLTDYLCKKISDYNHPIQGALHIFLNGGKPLVQIYLCTSLAIYYTSKLFVLLIFSRSIKFYNYICYIYTCLP